MKRPSRRALGPWMRKHPLLARLYALFLLVFSPLIVPAVAVCREWEHIRAELAEVAAYAFLPWDE